MRIAVSGPRRWKLLEKEVPERTRLAKEWLSIQLDLALIKEEVEGVSSLQLGLDTIFASLCLLKGIPLKIFLACRDQDKFWDPETREIFRHLLKQANKVVTTSDNIYELGCIQKQTQAITDWLTERDSRLLIIKNKQLSKTQSERKKDLPKSNVLIFKM